MQAYFGAKSAQFSGSSDQLIHDHYIKMMFFDVLRRFIFLFWREKIIPKGKFTEKTRSTTVAL
jgi:hypothetical protein